MCCVQMPYIASGTLVVINNDDEDQLQPRGPHGCPIGVVYRGQCTCTVSFPKLFLAYLGCSNIPASGLNKDVFCWKPKMIVAISLLIRHPGPSFLGSLTRETCP